MSYEYILEKYKRALKLIKGEFTERDFDFVIPGRREGEEDGRMTMGKMSPERRDLIISNAMRRKEDVEKKYPQVLEDVKEPVKEETKSKGKK